MIANGDAFDYKAEVIAAELLEEGILLDNIHVWPLGSAKRNYSKDVLSSEFSGDDEKSRLEIKFEVSREGLYDMLPEGMFHQPDPKKTGFTVDNLLDNIRRVKEEESFARRFFFVFEKEFYRARIRMEYNERRSIDSISGFDSEGYSNIFERELYLRIWPDLEGIDKKYRSALIQYLPEAYAIVGDEDLTHFVFRSVTGEPIELSYSYQSWLPEKKSLQSELGSCFLGYDAFATKGCLNDAPKVTLQIGPLVMHRPEDFWNEGKGIKLIDFMVKYFIPAECDFQLVLLLEEGSDCLILKAENEGSILGLNSRI